MQLPLLRQGNSRAVPAIPVHSVPDSIWAPAPALVLDPSALGALATLAGPNAQPTPGAPGLRDNNDVLIGGEGSDLLIGGHGRDVMVGGFGSDGPASDRTQQAAVDGDGGETRETASTTWDAGASPSAEAAQASSLAALDLFFRGPDFDATDGVF